MTAQSSLASRVIGSRETLAELANVITFVLDDGARCWVAEGAAEWQLDRASTASPSGTVVAPIAGPGRWLKAGGGGDITIPFPVGDIDAAEIPDGKIIVSSGGVAVWGDVPVAFDVTGFTHSPSLVQVGAAVVNPAFTASYNQSATSASLTDTDGHTDTLTLPATSFTSPHTFTKTTFGASVTFTLHASNALGSDTASTGIAWGENVYYGSTVDPGTYNEAFIEGLSGSVLKLSAAGSYSYAASAGQSDFFCALTSLGLTVSSFQVGGFPFACSKVASAVSVTNTQSITETYDVFRSDNTGLAPLTLVVA